MKALILEPGIIPGIICLRVVALFTAMCVCAWGWEGLFLGLVCAVISMPLIICFILAAHLLRRLPRGAHFAAVMAVALLMCGYYFDWLGLHERVYVSDWGPDPYSRSEGEAMRWMGIASVVLGVATAKRLLEKAGRREIPDDLTSGQESNDLPLDAGALK